MKDFPSRFLGVDRTVRVHLPERYWGDPSATFAVQYVHDGELVLDPLDWGDVPGPDWRFDETADRLVSEGAVEPFIVVAIDSTDARLSEYSPPLDPWSTPGSQGRSDLYGRFLVEELKPWVDVHLRTRCDHLNTGVMGASMGGLVSFYLLRIHPHVFGRVACVSSSFWWRQQQALTWTDEVLSGWQPGTRLWIDAGTAEGDDADRNGVPYMVEDARAIRDRLLRGGLGFGDELGYLEVVGAEHRAADWAARLSPTLRFLWGPRPLPAVESVELIPVGPHGGDLRVGERFPLIFNALLGPEMVLTVPASLAGLRVADRAIATVDQAGFLVGLAPGVTRLSGDYLGLSDALSVEVYQPANDELPILSFVVYAPAGTPVGERLFITGDLPELGSWAPNGVPLRRVLENIWRAEVEVPGYAAVRYKVTRGSWETAEADEFGWPLPNRTVLATGSTTLTLHVQGWEDQR